MSVASEAGLSYEGGSARLWPLSANASGSTASNGNMLGDGPEPSSAVLRHTSYDTLKNVEFAAPPSGLLKFNRPSSYSKRSDEYQ